jgi:hypothetical protein
MRALFKVCHHALISFPNANAKRSKTNVGKIQQRPPNGPQMGDKDELGKFAEVSSNG